MERKLYGHRLAGPFVGTQTGRQSAERTFSKRWKVENVDFSVKLSSYVGSCGKKIDLEDPSPSIDNGQ